MASFRYKAVNESGDEVNGVLIANSPADARARLREMSLFPEDVARSRDSKPRLPDWLPGRRAKAALHVTTFTQQCCVLLAAGVPIVEALDVLARQCESRALAAALVEIREEVSAGRTFAEALTAYPQFFDASYAGMVASGEKSGTMDVVFGRLAEFLQNRRVMHAKISTALIYPSILVLMVFGLLLFLSGVIIPQIAPLLNQTGRSLPLTTSVLFWVGDFVRNYIWLLIPCALALSGGFSGLRRTRLGKRWIDSMALRVPLFGELVRKGIVSRFTRTFATLLRTGIPVLECLDTMAELTPNALFAEEVSRIRDDVVEGKDMSLRMSRSALFPPLVGYMAVVGERSGNLADVLEHVADAYDVEVEIASRRVVAILEPALILAMAIVVGAIALSLVTTILELSSL